LKVVGSASAMIIGGFTDWILISTAFRTGGILACVL
jgi:hypothetical protein